MSFKKLIGFIHLWLGLTSGLVVFIVALTGAMYVFQAEIDQFVKPQHYFTEKQDKPFAPLSLWLDSANVAFKSYPVSTARSAYYKTAPGSVISIGASYKEKDKDRYMNAYLDPYTGKVLEVSESYGEYDFWRIVIDLHIQLLMGEFGGYLVKYGTLIFLLMLISGIILWWPKNKSAFKQRYKFKWKESTKWKRKNYDLHNVLGFYACWIVVFMAITGLVWAFEWFNNGLYFALSGGKQTIEESKPEPAKIKNAVHLSHFEKCLSKFQSDYPKENQNAEGLYLDFPADTAQENMRIYVYFNPKGIIEEDYRHYTYDRIKIQEVKSGKSQRANTGDWFRDFNGAIHYGSIFGLPSKLLVFFACLVAASLPITGFLVWWGRKSKKEKKPGKKKSFKNQIA